MCMCEPGWWRLPPSGAWRWSKHPRLRGKVMEVRAEHWTKQHFKVRVRPGDPWLTRATANYPKEMNRFLAKRLVSSALRFRIKRMKATVGGSMRRVGEFGNSLLCRRTLSGEATSPKQADPAEQIDKRIEFTVPLRGSPGS